MGTSLSRATNGGSIDSENPAAASSSLVNMMENKSIEAASTSADQFTSSVAQTLSQEDFDILLNNSLYSRKQIEDWYKEFLADCPNGKLSKSQLAESMKKCIFTRDEGNVDTTTAANADIEKYVERIFYTFDVDESGFIDFVEFLVALSITLRGKPQDKLKLAFDIYDLTSIGSVRRKEMLHIITSLYELMGKEVNSKDETPEARVDAIYKILRLDPDQSISKVEFIDGCLNDQIILQLLLSTACY